MKVKFNRMKTAYLNLYLGSSDLLKLDAVYWTERLLLIILRNISQKRLQSLNSLIPDEPSDTDNRNLRENIIEAQASAALGGHELGEWEILKNNKGFQATCSVCGGSVFVSASTLYSILTDTCSSQFMSSLDDKR